MKHTIIVRDEHIAEGRPVSCINCPIALAFLDSMPGGITNATVIQDNIEWYDTRAYRWMRADLPEAAGAFVREYDRLQPVEPFSFEIVTREMFPREV